MIGPTAPGFYTLDTIRALGDSGQYQSWNHASPAKSTPMQGWALILDRLDNPALSRQAYETATAEGRALIVDAVARAYEEASLFPIQYFSPLAERRVLQEALADDDPDQPIMFAPSSAPHMLHFDAQHSTKAARLCDFYFPNLFDTATAHSGSLRQLFQDPESLRRVVARSYRGPKQAQPPSATTPPPETPASGRPRKGVKPHPERLTASDLRAGYFARNFPPMVARALVKYYLPTGGVVLDPSAGFGGRLLGTLTAGPDYTYIGCDPNTETIYNLDRLGALIERTTSTKRRYELHCHGSEVLDLPANSVDLAFTSPPYFDLERYGENDPNHAEQCYRKHPDRLAWLTGYAAPTIERVTHALKQGAHFLVNIADSTTSTGDDLSIVDGWIAQAEHAGLTLIDIHYLANRVSGKAQKAYRSAAHVLDRRGNTKTEPILVFRKYPKLAPQPTKTPLPGPCHALCAQLDATKKI